MTLESKFNSKKAKKIRLGLGLTEMDLARELNERRGKHNGYGSVASAVHVYEKGIRQPRTDSKSRIDMDYLFWLKEQGYNPFGI